MFLDDDAARFIEHDRGVVDVEAMGIAMDCRAPILRAARGHDARHVPGLRFVPVVAGEHDLAEPTPPEQRRAHVDRHARIVAEPRLEKIADGNRCVLIVVAFEDADLDGLVPFKAKLDLPDANLRGDVDHFIIAPVDLKSVARLGSFVGVGVGVRRVAAYENDRYL